MRLIFIIHLLLIYIPISFGQKLTLEQCIEKAWLNNVDIKQAILNKKNASLDTRQARASRLPSLNLSTGQNYQFGRTVDRFTNSFVNNTIRNNNLSLSTNLLLFNGFQVNNTIKSAKLSELSAEYSLQNSKNQIALNVASLFLNVVQAYENKHLYQLQKENTNQKLEKAQKMYDAGASDLLPVLNFKAQLASDELNIVNAQNSINDALINLKNLLQIPIESDFDIIVPNIEWGNYKLQEKTQDVYLIAIQNVPEIKLAKQNIEIAKTQNKISRSGLFPMVSLSANLSTVYSNANKEIINPRINGTTIIGITQNTQENVVQPSFTFDTKTKSFVKQMEENVGQSLGINLNWNILSGLSTNTQIKKSELNYEIQTLNLLKAENTLKSSISLAVNAYNAALAKFEAVNLNLEAQKMVYQYYETKMNVGNINFTDYYNAKNNFNQANVSLLQAKYELVFRAFVIDYYKGKVIKL